MLKNTPIGQNRFSILLFLLPTVALFLLIYGFPLITLFFTSLFDYRIFPNRFEFVGLGNYIQLFTQDPIFHKAFANTMIWVLIHSIFHVALGVTVALVLARKPFGWKFVRTVYMVPNIISSAALAMIFINLYNPQYGLINGVIRLMGFAGFSQNWLFSESTAFGSITLTWFLFSAYTATLVLGEIAAIPEDIFEAARIDGASPLQIDLFITLPLLRNIIGTTVIMAATYMLQMFDLIYMTTKGGPGDVTMNLPLYLYKTALLENNYGYANTIGATIILVGIVAMVLITRLFRIGEAK